jgi:hypothetical protein
VWDCSLPTCNRAKAEKEPRKAPKIPMIELIVQIADRVRVVVGRIVVLCGDVVCDE